VMHPPNGRVHGSGTWSPAGWEQQIGTLPIPGVCAGAALKNPVCTSPESRPMQVVAAEISAMKTAGPQA
jgi:hypothetical protein